MTLTPFYLKVNASTSFILNLDAQIYDSDVATACGLTKTQPADGIDTIPVPARIALNSGACRIVKAKVILGKKRRTVPLICDKEKVSSINSALVDKTFTLGVGTGKTWTIQRVI